jgi:hypothetical protein
MLTQLGALPNQAFNQEPVIQSPVIQTPQQSSNETSNNSLNTFQDIEKAKTDDSDKTVSKLGEAIAEATKSENSSSDSDEDKTALSDERCKELFGADCNLLSAIADLDEYVYKYKESAKNNPALEGKGADDGTFVGPMAQDLASNPVTKDCVHEDPESGFLTVDTKHLSLTEMSLISMLAKRVEALEAYIYKKGEN